MTYNQIDGARQIIDGSVPVSKLTGAVINAHTIESATYPVSATDRTINCSSGTFTVTLPTAVGRAGQEFCIKNSGSGVITVDTTSSETIDGGGSLTLDQFDCFTVESDGSDWIITAVYVALYS